MLALDFKSREELQLMPQTMEEHLDELEDSDAGSQRRVSLSSFDESQVMADFKVRQQACSTRVRVTVWCEMLALLPVQWTQWHMRTWCLLSVGRAAACGYREPVV